MKSLRNLPASFKLGLAVATLLVVAGAASLLVAFTVVAVANSVFGVGLTKSTILVVGAVLPPVWWLSFGVWRKVLSTLWGDPLP